MTIKPENLTVRQAGRHLADGDFSVGELVQECIKNIEKKNPSLNIFLEVYDDLEKQISEAEQSFKKKLSSDMTGIPLALKDNILNKGKIATASSRILENYRATYDSTAVFRLKKKNPIFIGRTNMDEFAMGSSTENSSFGVTKNPLDESRVPGGSSGGSAASVLSGCALAALGSDTGGSIRQPASFCGLVGLKPTYGRVSRYGLIAMGSSLDQIGPITKTVGDAEIIFDLIKGEDNFDSTSIPQSMVRKMDIPRKMVIGVPEDIMSQEGIDKEVLANFKKAIVRFEKLGYGIKKVSMPRLHYALAVYYIIMPAEVSSNLFRFDGVKYGLHKSGDNLLDDYIKTRTEGFGKEARRRIMLGTYILSSGYYDSFYSKANELRRLVISDFENVFENGEKSVHAIITPTTPTTAFKIGEKISDPLTMYMSDVFTTPANIAGLPAISVPSGVSGENLPIGLQITAPSLREDILFKIGKDFLGEE